MRLFVALALLVLASTATAQDRVDYLDRLATAGPDADADVDRLVAQLWPILPDTLRRALGAPAPDAGLDLVAWWHAQDPLPATPENERLTLHLDRVAHAERRFADASRRGFDDRGAVFVRLGEPDVVRELRSQTLLLSRSSLAVGTPDNALWVYDGGRLGFLFVEDGRTWREASPVDLLPPGLQMIRQGEMHPRAPEWAKTSALAFYDLMDAIAAVIPQYALALPTVDALHFEITGDALEAGMSPTRFAEKPSVSQTFTSGGTAGDVPQIVASLFEEIEAERQQAARATRDVVSGVDLPPVAEMPVAVRAARFRGPGGRTRVEVAWAPEPGAFVGLGDGLAVRSVATVAEAGGRGDGDRAERVSPLSSLATRPGQTTPVEAATFQATGRRLSVAVQTDVLDAEGAAVRRGIARVGPLAPLTEGPGGLLISDPLPHLVPPDAVDAISGAPRAQAERARARWRYPYDMVVPGALVGVFVEAYDLGTRGGRSDYEVERSIYRTDGATGERSLVSLSATPSGTTSGTAREFIVLPVPADVRAGDRVVFEGTIRDRVTGRSGTWSLVFSVVGGSG
ncbi:GWxTD domain-containing protein [Rubrivirga sp.]|uniref:GWxTD domain-containing protein n=1 Tax=Rubrivirga sp. TaxID=1885344 RepID=UPI003B51FC4E